METFVFMGLSLILLVPIVYFLPLGLNVKGKMTIVGVSLFVSLIGLLASFSFSVWTAALLSLLLLMPIALIIGKRSEQLMFANSEVAAGQENVFQVNEDYDFGAAANLSSTDINEHGMDDTDSSITYVKASITENAVLEEYEINKADEPETKMPFNDMGTLESVNDEPALFEEKLEPANEVEVFGHSIEEMLLDDETAFLNNRELLPDREIRNLVDENGDIVTDNMYEHMNLSYDAIDEVDSEVVPQIEEVDNIDFDLEEIFEEDWENVNDETSIDTALPNLIEVIEERKPEQSNLHQDLLNNMLSQIESAQAQLNPDEFEKLLKALKTRL